MKQISRCRISVLLVAASVGGCLATDPPVDEVEPPDLVTFRDVQVGALHSCGLTTRNEIFCWGENSSGQLGTGDNIFRTVPWPASHGDEQFTAIAPGASHSCALSTEDVLFCWGANNAGQLGQGDTSEVGVQVPVKVSAERTYDGVTAGGAHSCAITVGRVAYCWGTGLNGQLGTGYAGTAPRPTPDSVLADQIWELLTAGSEHTCGLTVGGEVYCWGLGLDGRLGLGSSENYSEPARVGDDMQFFAIDAGHDHTCALALDGFAYCWGNGSLGQLGTGTLSSSDVPVAVTGGLVFNNISAGGGFTCGVTSDYKVYCWGRNDVGQLGDGTLDNRYEPALVGGGKEFRTVSAGLGSFGATTCGMATDGLAYCWGDGRGGQTGTGDATVVTAPVRVFGQEEG